MINEANESSLKHFIYKWNIYVFAQAQFIKGTSINEFVAAIFPLFKLRCNERFTHAFTACGSVFKVITLVG